MEKPEPLSVDQLREICALVVELTRLRQNECKHLCIENFAPELLGKLLCEFFDSNKDAAALVAVERGRCVRAVIALQDGPDCGDADGYMRALRDAEAAISKG